MVAEYTENIRTSLEKAVVGLLGRQKVTRMLYSSSWKWATAVAVATLAFGQQAPSQPSPQSDKANAYYHYAMGHLYAELAAAYGNRSEYLNNAIENYRAALKADPKAGFIVEELADLYVNGGAQLSSAVSEAEEAIKANPGDLNARRLLGRIYSRMLGDREGGRLNQQMIKKAIEQYERITETEPEDIESLLMLGRLQKIAQNSPESEKAYRKVLEIEPDNEDANIGLAMVLADLGDHKASAELLEKAAAKSPNLRTLTSLAQSYEQMRDFKLAAETLRRAIDISPGNPDLKRAYAQSLMFADQYDEALKVYKELTDEEPKDSQSWLRMSQIYRQQRKFAEARDASAKAQEAEPNSLEIRYNEVALLEAEGKVAQAIEVMKGIVDATAKRSYASAGDKASRVMLLERLALLYRQNDQAAEAVEVFREMASVDSEMGARASAQIVETYRGARDFDKAVAEADAARSKYPDDRMVKLVRANLLAEIGRGDEAAKEVRTLLDGKSDREVYLSLAQIYEKSKNYQEMGNAIDAAEKLSGDPVEKENLHFMRGAMLEKMKRYDESEAEFRKVLAVNPLNASALNYLGYMLADRNVRLAEAHQMIQKAVDQEPDNGAYLDSLGWVLFRMNRLDEAEKALARAVERAPHDPTVHDHLGDVYAEQGRLKDAISQWERSVAEWKATPPSDQDTAEIAKVQKKLDSGRVKLAQQTSSPSPKQ